jgi:hypothetical protein
MGDLLIKGSFTTGGTVTASIAQIPLPNNWGAITTSSLLLSNSLVGLTARGYISAPTTSLIYGLIAQPSSSYLNVSNSGNAQYDVPVSGSAVFNSSEKEYISELRIPVNEWKSYGVIVGSFAGIEKCANDYECTDTFSAYVNSAGVISQQNIPWLSSCSAVGSGTYNCTYLSYLKDGTSPLSGAMNCKFTGGTMPQVTTATTSSGFGVTFSNSAGTGTNSDFYVSCQKGTNDYKPKTAKVASSIGVPTVPGITTSGAGNLIDTFSFSYARDSAVNSTCNTSPCYVRQIGSAVSSVTRSGSASYAANFAKTYSQLNCTASATNGGTNAGITAYTPILSCVNCNSFTFATGNPGATVDTYGTFYCQGSY